MQEQLAEAARFFLNSFRYKLYFSNIIDFSPKYLKLLIKVISSHRLHVICGPARISQYVNMPSHIFLPLIQALPDVENRPLDDYHRLN